MNAAEIGLSATEVAEFSVARLMRSIVDPSFAAKGGGFELAACEAVRKHLGREDGFFLPDDIMRRTLTATGGTSAGGAVVQTTVDRFAPALRPAPRVVQLGATVLQSKESLAIPRLKPGGTAAAVTENSSKADSDPTFELVTYAPKTIRNNIAASRRLLQQTDLAERIIRYDLEAAVAEMVDLYAIQGSGSSGQPTGILSTSGLTTVSLGTNGAAPTYAAIIDLVRQVGLKKNYLSKTAGFIASTKAAATMRNVTKTASWGFIWDDAQDDLHDGWLCGYPAMMSESVPSNLTKGTGTNLSATVFGNWEDLYIVEFSPIAILPDPYTYSSTGAIRFNVYQEVDIAPRRTDAFAAIVDMIAS